MHLLIIKQRKENKMSFGKRNYQYRSGNHGSESRAMTIAIIIGIAIIALLIYLF